MCAVPAGPKMFGMRKKLDLRPWQWLAAGPIPIPDVAGVLATFRPGTARVVCFSGPHTLCRAAGWGLKKGKPEQVTAYGSWWADAAVLADIGQRLAMFDGWLPDAMLQRAHTVQYRGAVALCEDWNDMGEMFRMELPVGQEIEGLVGISAPQPQYSGLDPKLGNTPILQGGAEQVFFKRTPELNSINPLWVYPER